MDFEKCSSDVSSHKIITVAENKRRFSLRNEKGIMVRKVEVDGCLIDDDRRRCDYLFEIGDPLTLVIYVELKGSDVVKAFAQLESTIIICAKRHSSAKKSCYIIASRVPKIGPKIQNRKKMFLKKHRAPVSLETVQAEYKLE